jgi:hypothetical protein
MLAQRDRVERELENLMDDVDQDGNPLDPRRDTESTYEDLGSRVDHLNRAMFTDYVKLLTVTGPPTPNQLAAILADVDQQLRSTAAAPSPAIFNESLKRLRNPGSMQVGN